MRSSGNARADQTHAMMQDLADHWGLIVFPGATIATVAL